MSDDFVFQETRAEVSVEWKIKRFLSLPDDPDYRLHSPTFSLSDVRLFLVVWPNGRTVVDSVRWISLYLSNSCTTSKEQWVKGSLGFRNRDLSVYESFDFEYKIEKYKRKGRSRFVRASQLRQSENVFLPDGTLKVFATFQLSEPNILEKAIVGIPRGVPFRATHTEEVSVEWELEEFSSLPKEEGFSVESHTFSFAGAVWCMKLYPFGADSSCLGWVSLFLYRERSLPKNQTVAYTFGICNHDDTVSRLFHNEGEFITNTRHGRKKFLKSSELLDSEDSVTSKGSVRIFCIARANPMLLPGATSLERDTQTFPNSSHEERTSRATPTERDKHSQSSCGSTLQENLNTFFLSERLADVTIQVQEEKLQAHKAILAARSSVFSAMFEHDTEERRTGIINIEDFDPVSFKAFLSFLYSGDLEVVSANNVIALYKAADKYYLQDLKSECIGYLQKELSLDSFFDVVQLAFMYRERILLEHATEFFINHTKEIFLVPEWQAMTIENPALINELLIKMATKRL